ncbi:SAM-dependent methyltransferase [Bacillus cereus]|nr:SAM-dependent methyltransferase [Bacillus cereus]PFI47767.1 SAM-dependent methyltransferase [Bacillus cereus]
MDKYYYGELCSLFYDIDKPEAPKDELNFLLSFAKKNMKILEPMCGSGRFLIPFLQEGFDIDGFDISKDMIARCKEKLSSKNLSTRIDLCDFATFEQQKEHYDLIFIAATSFSLLTELEEINRALLVMKNSLKPTGRIIFGIETDINYRNNKSEVDEYTLESEEFQEGKRVKKGSIEVLSKGKSAYNPYRKIMYSSGVYQLYIDDEYIREECENFLLRLYKPNELDGIIEKSGLTIANKYTNFAKNDFNFHSAEEIFYELHK